MHPCINAAFDHRVVTPRERTTGVSLKPNNMLAKRFRKTHFDANPLVNRSAVEYGNHHVTFSNRIYIAIERQSPGLYWRHSLSNRPLN